MLQNLERLRVFHHVYELGSLRDAARVLNVTQSAVSQQLAKLEAEIGSQLFVRLHKKLLATAASHALARSVGRFLREIEADVEAIRRGRDEPVGVLRVGAPAVFGAHWLPAQIAEFRRGCPGVRFEVTLGHPDQLLPQVENGQLDFAFTDVFEEPPRGGPLSFQNVLEEELILIASGRYHRSALGGNPSFEALCSARYVSYAPSAKEVRHWFRHHHRRDCPKLDLALSIESVPGVVAGVKAHLGLGVVPVGHVEPALREGRLLEIVGKARRIRNQIAIAQLVDKRPSAAERHFVRFVSSGQRSTDPRLDHIS
ncbi:MAG TPA: LysR family transcriptional regulator [Polyangiaceae bacterium]|nr:LysR family transcriptional regulator [Polyangiaceae bacterium]